MNDILYFLIYLFGINLIGFATMYMDKKRSINRLYRVREKTIFIIALFLGAIGIYIGMYKFRHKTQHKTFTVLIPVLIVLNITSIYYIFTNINSVVSFLSKYAT